MSRIVGRIRNRWRYDHNMTRPQAFTAPERRLDSLDHWVGMWVAVRGGEVIAAAYNSADLVPKVIEMGPRGEGAVAQYVPEPTSDIVIGVG